jgi:hypothetical protein
VRGHITRWFCRERLPSVAFENSTDIPKLRLSHPAG